MKTTEYHIPLSAMGDGLTGRLDLADQLAIALRKGAGLHNILRLTAKRIGVDMPHDLNRAARDFSTQVTERKNQ